MIDEREWNLTIDLILHGEEFEPISPAEYTVDLLLAISRAALTEAENTPQFKANLMTRKRLSNWIKDFSKYLDFVDGCWLLMAYYNTGDVIKSADEWGLVELHRRWSSVINLSMYYGNAYQISNFVPFANDVVNNIVREMIRRKGRCTLDIEKRKRTERPANWRLEVKQVRERISMERVFEHYFPDMHHQGREYIAACRWHDDDPRRNPNLNINTEKGVCYCRRCGAGFDVFGMIMDLDRTDFATALHTAWELGK